MTMRATLLPLESGSDPAPRVDLKVGDQPECTLSKRLGATTETVTRAHLRNEKIAALGRREPATVEAGTPIGETLARMRTTGGISVVVCRDGRVTGILTERDVLLKVLGREIDTQAPVDQFMTPDPDTLSPEATVGEALVMMEAGGYRNLPLLDDHGNLAGILRLQDVLEYVAEAFPQEILNLPPRPHQKMEEPEGA